MRAPLRFAVACILLLLSACVSPVSRVEGPQQPVDLSTLAEWSASGRIAISAAGTGGSGSFHWQQNGMRTDVQIQGPVGIGGLRLSLEADEVRLETSDGRQLESSAAWAELEARLGAPVPARNLRYWLLGIPAPGEHRWLEVAPPFATLEQDEWRIAYERFSEETGTHLPTRFTATSGASRVRLVIDRWRLGPPAQ